MVSLVSTFTTSSHLDKPNKNIKVFVLPSFWEGLGMGYILIALFMLCFSVGVKGQNLVLNGDFELGPTESTEDWANAVDTNCNILGIVGGPTFWTVTSSSPDRLYEGDIQCGWDNDTASSGSAYVMLGFGSFTESGKTTLISQLMVDSAYRLSCYLQLETARSSTLIPSRLSFLFNNNGDSIPTPMISDSTNWLYYDTIFIATANSTEMEIMNSGGLSFGVKLDNIILEKISITSVSNISLQNQIKVFPNPTNNGIINLHFSKNKRVKYNLYNALGKEITIGNFENNQQIDLTNHSHGIYFLRFQIEDSVFTKKIIYH
jgi:Secretion system C-terminal sorting domain